MQMSRATKLAIERKAATLRRQVMEYAKCQYPEAKNARAYLHARYAAEFLRYTYTERPDLDVELRLTDESAGKKVGVITGLLDRAEKVIAVSDRFSPAEKRYSAWHELGHLVLHPSMSKLHRDRLPNGQAIKPPIEMEADYFAAVYGMPRKWITQDVEAKFGELPIKVSQNLLWWLSRNDPECFEFSNVDELDVEKTIATCTNIGNGPFVSLAEEYGVSAEAMARRLRELRLVDHGWRSAESASS